MQSGIERVRPNDPVKAAKIEAWLDEATELYRILPLDTDCMREWARLVGNKPLELRQDALLAATARVHRLTVATRNVKDFEHLHVPVFNPFDFRG
jgi:predicted nucleic acid-binding protein